MENTMIAEFGGIFFLKQKTVDQAIKVIKKISLQANYVQIL